MRGTARKVLLAPIDPVHDVGLKVIKRALEEAGHEVVLLPPDVPVEEVVSAVLAHRPDYLLISRTVGYQVEEVLARLVDLADAAGVRGTTRMIVGGMAIRPELAAEMGFDAGFGPGTKADEVVAYVEGRECRQEHFETPKAKRDITAGYAYAFRDGAIASVLDAIVEEIIRWTQGKTSPGVERARLRRRMLEVEKSRPAEGKGGADRELAELRARYGRLCERTVGAVYEEGCEPPRTRFLSGAEQASLETYVDSVRKKMSTKRVQQAGKGPCVFVQYGTGCPFMDVAHIKIAEAWGADGVVHFDPSWGARTEGLAEGLLAHEQDGSILTPQNLECIRNSLSPGTIWQVRAHRGLNTPETVVLAGELGADLTKINIAYGSLGAGTDPARLTCDGVEAMRLAAAYGLPFDVVTNEELSGVPAYKAFAGMLIGFAVGIRLGARPILQPLFCYSPEVMIGGQMDDNFIDFNAAKIVALRRIVDAPIWPGAPIGFLTQTEDRVQSSLSTSLHAAMAASLGVDAITIASADEAYSGGPISGAARVDTLRGVEAAFRFVGSGRVTPTDRAAEWAEAIDAGIREVLARVAEKGSFVEALYAGLLGSREEGAYPGRAGRGTVRDEG